MRSGKYCTRCGRETLETHNFYVPVQYLGETSALIDDFRKHEKIAALCPSCYERLKLIGN